ncbi:unnamed protein product [Lupinus luteus]|uniref:Uncharacterized protein n=1 Tax=Lupinus luteus TaxID=3873 RepID=A0AAV1XXZ4_LUPLU
MKWQTLEYTTPSCFQELGIKNVEENNEESVCSSGYATPKGKRFRIQEVLTCPPPTNKRRIYNFDRNIDLAHVKTLPQQTEAYLLCHVRDLGPTS